MCVHKHEMKFGLKSSGTLVSAAACHSVSPVYAHTHTVVDKDPLVYMHMSLVAPIVGGWPYACNALPYIAMDFHTNLPSTHIATQHAIFNVSKSIQTLAYCMIVIYI